MKVGIVGAGRVGSTIAYTLSMGSQASHIVLVDINEDKAKGEVLDLRHGLPFIPYTTLEYGGVDALEDMEVVVVTAGLARKPEETRLDLAKKNNELFRKLIPEIAEANTDGIYVIVSNPVDVLTYAAIKYSSHDPRRVFGSGNILDTARFRSLLGEYFRVEPSNVHAYVLGEHGQSAFPVLSQAFIGCTPITEMVGYSEAEVNRLFEEAKSVSAEIIKLKGATNYAVSLGVSKIIEAIYLGQNKVMPVSTLLTDFLGVSDLCMSVPAVINGSGVDRLLPVTLDEVETQWFRSSAEKLGEVLDELGLRVK